MEKNIKYCLEIGFNVRAIVCDQGSNNRSAFKTLIGSQNDFIFQYQTQKIYLLYDHRIIGLIISKKNLSFASEKSNCVEDSDRKMYG